MENKNYIRQYKWLKYLTYLGFIAIGLFIFYGWRAEIFRSEEAMEAFLAQFGTAAILVFFLLQAFQVVVPIFPSAVGYVSAAYFWGPLWGFVMNYIAIFLGSCAAFALAKAYGQRILYRLFKPETVKKYEHWTEKNNHFLKLFRVAILLPIAPDDFLCYLAGTTRMTWKQFVFSILLLKPLSLVVYSFGVHCARLFL